METVVAAILLEFDLKSVGGSCSADEEVRPRPNLIRGLRCRCRLPALFFHMSISITIDLDGFDESLNPPLSFSSIQRDSISLFLLRRPLDPILKTDI